MKSSEIIKNGLWHNNPAIMQLLGLCPLLAVSNTLITAMTLGLATIIVLMLSNTIISLIKNHIDYNLRIPYFMLVIASIVTCLIFVMQAYSYSLYQSLGVYIALITTNCVILGRIEAFAYKNNVLKSCLDGLSNGLGFSLVLIILGSIREILGQGTLFANSHLLFGEYGHHLVIYFNTSHNNFIIALLPPGAFFILGFLIALKNHIKTFKSKNLNHKINEQRTYISDIPKFPAKKS